MNREFQLHKFTKLWFSDNMKTAAIILGYAAELTLKQMLVASGNDNDKKLMNSQMS